MEIHTTTTLFTAPHTTEKRHQVEDQYHDRDQDEDGKEKRGEGICERVERLMMVSRPEKRPAIVSCHCELPLYAENGWLPSFR